MSLLGVVGGEGGIEVGEENKGGKSTVNKSDVQIQELNVFHFISFNMKGAVLFIPYFKQTVFLIDSHWWFCHCVISTYIGDKHM